MKKPWTDFIVTSPKTIERFRVSAARVGDAARPTWQSTEFEWTTIRVWISRESARYGDRAGTAELNGGGTASLTHLRIDSHLYPEHRGSGVGAALYLACAVIAGEFGYEGISSQDGLRSVYAARLWERFRKLGLSRRVRDNGRVLDLLDADVAWGTGLVARGPRMR